MISALFLLAVSVLTASASPAEEVSNLHRRYPFAGGGWALIIPATGSCPAGTYLIPDIEDDSYGACCPTTLQAANNQSPGTHTQQWGCCPPGETCLDALAATPFCADSSWSLWNSSQSFMAPTGFFCCGATEQGTLDIACDSGTTVVSPSLLAISLGSPLPTGAAAATATYSVTGISAASGSSTSGTATTSSDKVTTSVIVKTTVSGGKTVTVASTVTGVLGTLESLASSVVHNDGVVIRPLDFSGLRVVAVWSTVVMAMAYGAFAIRAF